MDFLLCFKQRWYVENLAEGKLTKHTTNATEYMMDRSISNPMGRSLPKLISILLKLPPFYTKLLHQRYFFCYFSVLSLFFFLLADFHLAHNTQ